MYAAGREDNPGWQPPIDGGWQEVAAHAAGVCLDFIARKEERVRKSYHLTPETIGLAGYPEIIRAFVDQVLYDRDANAKSQLEKIVADEFWSRIRLAAEGGAS